MTTLEGSLTAAPGQYAIACSRFNDLGAGRERVVRWGPRTLDLDLLFYDDTVIGSNELTLPHPRIDERPFVLVALKEVAPHRVPKDPLWSEGDIVPLGQLRDL